MNSGAKVHCRQIQKKFSQTGTVLDSIDLDILPGEFVTFLGPSGCGKSTLLKLIAGLESPDSGHVQTTDHGAPLAPGKLGFVFQESRLLPWLSVLENVELPLKLLKQSETSARANAALDLVHYKDTRNACPRELSGGMKMRVAIARAWVTRPQLLLLDEPFSALDEQSRNLLQLELRNLWMEMRPTVLFVTHSLSEALFLSEKVLGFSNRPAKIISEFIPDFPTVRTPELRYQSIFSDQLFKLSNTLPWLR